ncbi:hypothetical protein [Chitiniphilus shinanonensis]|uniref:hypothetical protein n=1 Tax=Chitiniphilus shinanonensis TaxID=553088 RepID=UPI00304AF3D0
MTDLVTTEPRTDVVVVQQPATVVIEQRTRTEVVEVAGRQGPPGPAGPIGPAGGSAFTRRRGETLSALRVVYEQAGEVFALDYRDAAHIGQLLGLTLTAGDAGSEVDVQRSGAIDDAGWSWTPGPVWLGVAGALTQVPPADGFDVLVGAAVSATRLILDVSDPISLEV